MTRVNKYSLQEFVSENDDRYQRLYHVAAVPTRITMLLNRNIIYVSIKNIRIRATRRDKKI